MDKLQTYIGALAVDKEYLTQEQLNQCIAALDAEDSDRNIDDILIERGYIDQAQLQSLRKKRMVNIKKLETQIVSEYVKKMKIVSGDRLNKCLEIQENARQQKKFIPLSMLLVSHGLITQAKADEIEQSKEVQCRVSEAIWSNDPRRTGLIGRVLGGYEILSKIAEGGMGVVYKALQLELDRTVAFKILFEKFASQKKHLNQFFREAKLSAALNHPNLVHIFEMGHDQGFHYYAMELVEGNNVGDDLKAKETFSQQESLDIITQAGRGLEHIHNFDIVHRDIKPSNFLIRPDGIVKIMDLGLARQLNKLQKKAATIGTPYYMSPELIHSPAEADQRADIYALGVSFYRMLTGHYPITGSDAKEILRNIKEQIPLPVRQHDSSISADIEKVLVKVLAKDPNERYQNMAEMLNDLDRILLY